MEEVKRANRRIDTQQQKQVIGGLLKSVKELNRRGFVHLDVKPQNLYFDSATGETSLIDTGTLHKVSKNDPRSKYVKTFQGSSYYRHERGWLKQAHGTEADLYATAIMAVEMALIRKSLIA